jgi:hypothetical protein
MLSFNRFLVLTLHGGLMKVAMLIMLLVIKVHLDRTGTMNEEPRGHGKFDVSSIRSRRGGGYCKTGVQKLSLVGCRGGEALRRWTILGAGNMIFSFKNVTELLNLLVRHNETSSLIMA